MEERPPPLPRCRSTRTISRRLATTITIESTVIIVRTAPGVKVAARSAGRLLARQGYLPARKIPRSGSTRGRHRGAGRHADRGDLLGVEARAPPQGAVDVVLLEDLGGVGRLHRTAVDDAYAGREL